LFLFALRSFLINSFLVYPSPIYTFHISSSVSSYSQTLFRSYFCSVSFMVPSLSCCFFIVFLLRQIFCCIRHHSRQTAVARSV
jgi:hypothetical protein